MSTTFAAITYDADDKTSARANRRWPAGLVAGLAAGAATTAAVLVARAVGEEVAIAGERIPTSGFAMFTAIGALIGVAIASVVSRRARAPRSTFVRTTVVLTAMSIVPDVVADATVGAKLVLIATHLIAAAIIVPAIAARVPVTN